MRTLREQAAYEKQGRDLAATEEALNCSAVLKNILERNIPMFSGSSDPALHTRREEIRLGLINRTMPRIWLACDECRTELVNMEPGVVLLSNPPQRRVACPGCGWIGSTAL